MQWVGYIAAALVFCTFYMRTMLPLRWMAIASNVAFLTYGVSLQLWPIVILHGLLLPLNTWRLCQLYRMLAGLRAATSSTIDIHHLLALVAHHRYAAATVLFRKGDVGDCAYYIAAGDVEIPERSVRLGPGEFFGEIGAFSTARRRTASAICATDAELYRISHQDLVAAFYQQPQLAMALVRLIADRLAANAEHTAAAPAVQAD
ncbi:MAG TPA: cyclic nucleotide-binding domain-containing protein [Acetobacteraceae bacterium]|nr:cyclic nucleotide-binding domain-containing protein [Acetobacteraceae bacterium]